LQNEEIPVN